MLVTGGTGLLGSWLISALLGRGAEVVALVRDDVPDAALARSGDLGRVRMVRGAVEDLAVVERALAEYGVAAVFHLAAQTIVGTARSHPVGTFEANVRGTWNLLEACRRTGTVRGIVVASSDKAYGDLGRRPYDEDDPLRGTHPYDASKACADILARGFAATYGLPVAVTRCGNLYGGGDLNWSRLIPGTIRALLRGERPVVRSTGEPVRDYLYVEDAAAFYLVLMDALLRPRPGTQVRGRAFNASPGAPVRVLDVVQHVALACGAPDLAPVVLGEARDEIAWQALSPERARRDLGWTAATTLQRGLELTVPWYRKLLGAG